jgi:hypothetical protein|tara:strand:- start:11 stop:289 length:279 start_codon:yes stop_codon:yes gene_type:complete
MTKQKKPMFERRHYEIIAKLLGGVKSAKLTREINGDLRADGYYHSIWHTEDLFYRMFEMDNPNFDADRFKNAVRGAEELARLSPEELKSQII